ncbi:MAG: NAD(+) diphosphatase [Parvibaculaceae bacterium]
MPEIPLPAYVGSTLDRAAALRTDAAWIDARRSDPTSRFLRFFADRPRIDVSNGDALGIAYDDWERAGTPLEGTEPVFLGIDGERRAVFALMAAAEPPEDPGPGIKLIDLRSLAVQAALPPADLGLLAQARSLLHWHWRHRFCSNCGARTEPTDAGYRRHCGSCRAEHFPRTDPVVIVAVGAGNLLLLGRQPSFSPGMYSALAGFVEPGESIEEAARREILEESGVRLGAVRYVASQPWPFPASLMIGLAAEAVTTDLKIEEAELEDCRWFEREEVLAMLEGRHAEELIVPGPLSMARYIIRDAVGA